MRADAPAAEQGAAGRAVLVTVHGTGAGDETGTGSHWWQQGSAFLRQLGERLDLDPSRVEIVPFQWGEGPNSEEARREAGERLHLQLMGYEASGVDYYLIGHSHGGSVVHNVLLRSAALGVPLERLRCWCTVGTPFLDYRRNRFLFQRLRNFRLLLYASAVVAFFLGLWMLLSLWLEPSGLDADQVKLAVMGASLVIYGLLCVPGLYLHERWRHKSWYLPRQKRKAAEWYQSRWLGLWHLEDEAISALSNVRKVDSQIIPSTFLTPISATAQLLALIGGGLWLAYDMSLHDGEVLLGIATDFMEDLVDESSGTLEQIAALTWMNSWMIVIFFLPLVYFVSLFLKITAKVLGVPLSRALNRLVWTSVRQRAWGDDVLKEDVGAVASHPAEFSETFGPLPETVAMPLREHSEKHAIVTLHKVREVLGMTRGARASADLRDGLAENLTWQELIHTSYFDVPEFVDLVALGLHRAGLDVLSDFSLTAERQALARWCDGSQGPAATA